MLNIRECVDSLWVFYSNIVDIRWLLCIASLVYYLLLIVFENIFFFSGIWKIHYNTRFKCHTGLANVIFFV